MLKINDIIHGRYVFEMRFHEGLWAMYKRVEVQEVCLETLNQRKQIVIQKNPYSLMRKALKH